MFDATLWVCLCARVRFLLQSEVKEAELIRDWKSYKRGWLSLTSVLLQTHTHTQAHARAYTHTFLCISGTNSNLHFSLFFTFETTTRSK